MDSAAVKETRRLLRQVQDHLLQAHLLLGAEQHNLGMVDVIYHPTNRVGELNYVTPRRNTAWVSGNFVEDGLKHLIDLSRTPRVHYIEGLFPPLFAQTLRELNLSPEYEIPVMIYTREGIDGVLPPPVSLPDIPEGVRYEQVSDQRGIELWWYVYRNAIYEVLTLGVEPLIVGRDIAALYHGKQLDIILYRYQFPVGVVRLSLQRENDTAHILALALMHEVRTTDMTRLLLAVGMQAAIDRGYKLIFAPGEAEADRRLLRGMGFMDFGSIVCYAARSERPHQGMPDDALVKSVLTFR